LVWGHGLRLLRDTWGFAFAPRFAAKPGLGQDAPDTAAADLETVLRQQMFDPTRTIRATALGKIARDHVL